LLFGYFDFLWKNFEKNALRVSGSETFSFDSMQTAMFRALFEQDEARIKESVQCKTGIWMNSLQLVFWWISMFSSEMWRN
jgi:hypothetical protein